MSALSVVPTPHQLQEKSELEKVIKEGLSTFNEVGEALATIKAKQLYFDFGSFEEYLEKKWSIGVRQAKRLIAASEVATIKPSEAPERPALAQNATANESESEADSEHPLPPPANHPEMDLNLVPKLSSAERARSYALISEWFQTNKDSLMSARADVVVRRILSLFK